MEKSFRPWDVEQAWLLPPSVHDFVPKGHLAHFVRETVRESLDLSEIFASYQEERGYPPFHPGMMTALLLYAYCQGIYSSRRIARACEERVDFMAVTGLQKPDFRTVNRFRGRHLGALQGLFVQIVRLCGKAGLVKLGHVSLDGTKVHANASKHAAMSYKRMLETEKKLTAEVKRWFDEAEAADAAEDDEYGPDQRGDELPDWVSDKKKRLEKIKEAKAELEAEARAEEEARREKSNPAPGKKRGRPSKSPPGVPKDGAQRNFTDADSRIMKQGNGFEQCYNAQAVVDSGSQVIVSAGLTNSPADTHALPTMVAQIKANTGRQAQELSADAGYLSEDNLAELARRRIRGFIAIGRHKHGASAPVANRVKPEPGTRRYAMWVKLKRGGHRSRYRLRKVTVEPVFGQMKHGRGFRQFLLRGLDKVTAEWQLLCAAHNLVKLGRAMALPA
jgi:transposase